jgi:hypothetical protein
LTFPDIALRLRAATGGDFPPLGRWQSDSGTTRLGETNRNRLLRRSRAMHSFSNVVHFFAYKFARLRAWGFSLLFVASCSFDNFVFPHVLTSSH